MSSVTNEGGVPTKGLGENMHLNNGLLLSITVAKICLLDHPYNQNKDLFQE